MTARTRICRYVRFVDMDAYLDLGWHFDGGDPLHMPHGAYSVIMEFLCDCPMREPEIWRDIFGFEDFYQASSLGRIRSLDRMLVKPHAKCGYPRRVKGGILSPVKTGEGQYLSVNLSSKENKKRRFYVAHLVALAFHGPCPVGLEVCHNDGDNSNNAVSNIRYDTHEGNENDKARHGTRLEGERAPSALLTELQVREIRRRAVYEPFESISAGFGIKPATIQAIVNGKTWRSLPLLPGEAGTLEGNALKLANLGKRRSEFIAAENKRRAMR